MHSENSKRYRGIFLNLMSAAAFYFATYYLKKGTQFDDSISHIYVYARYLSGSLFIGLYIILNGHFLIPTKARKFVFWRAVFNILAVLAFYKAVESGSTGQANVLNMTYPVFVFILSWPLLGERPAALVALFLLIALTGILLNLPINSTTESMNLVSIGLGILSAIFAALAIISLRGAVQNARPESVMFWMFISGAIVLTPFCLKQLIILKPEHYVFISLSAFSGVLGQWLLARSYQYLDASTGSIISSSRIPIAIYFGWLLLNESMVWYSILGAILIALANVLLALHSNKEKYV